MPGAGSIRSAVSDPALPVATDVPGKARAAEPAYSKSLVRSYGCTVYENFRIAVPLPPAYVAFRGTGVPASSVRTGGGPDRKTGLVK